MKASQNAIDEGGIDLAFGSCYLPVPKFIKKAARQALYKCLCAYARHCPPT